MLPGNRTDNKSGVATSEYRMYLFRRKMLRSFIATVHALLHKRDTRAATIWIGLVWLIPLIGPILYLALGVNRIRRRAITLGVHKTFSRPVPDNLGETEHAGAEHLHDVLALDLGRSSE